PGYLRLKIVLKINGWETFNDCFFCLGVIGLFKLSGLGLILVYGIYQEICPFLFGFPILWSTGF
ncbi:hypothetical protein ACQP3C_29875, partial [Escherichia coli]